MEIMKFLRVVRVDSDLGTFQNLALQFVKQQAFNFLVEKRKSCVRK